MAEKKTKKAEVEATEAVETVEAVKTKKTTKTVDKTPETEEVVKTKKAAKTVEETPETAEVVESKKPVKAVEETSEIVETTEATETSEKVEEAPVKSVAQANPEKFLKDFNWHNYEEGIDQVDDKQLQEFEKLVSENFFFSSFKWCSPNLLSSTSSICVKIVFLGFIFFILLIKS